MKKLLSLACSSLFAVILSVNAFAGGPDDQPVDNASDTTPVLNGSGFTLGTSYATWGVSDFAIMGGYLSHWFSASIGGGYTHEDNAAIGNSSTWELRTELGLRQMLEHSLFLTYGGTYSQGFRSPENTAFRNEPYQWGMYVGLDYQPLHHLLLSVQLLPYSDEHRADRTDHSNVFTDGTISAAYIFNS